MIRKQRLSQLFFAFLNNPYLYGLWLGNIYQGKLKLIPCAGLNCHSCPAAVFVCPVGALQFFAAYGRYHITFYVLGFVGSIGAVGGRIVCGWACPFGLLQDLLNRIPSPRVAVPQMLEPVKYYVLFVLVLGVAYYTQEPWFCKTICPAGTLEAGFPLLMFNGDLRQLIGTLFFIKCAFLFLFVVWMIAAKRPFCRTLCPLGALYACFNKVSLVRLKFDREKCIRCGMCRQVCPTEVKLNEQGAAASNCIRCFRCTACPENAVSITCLPYDAKECCSKSS
ncbi:MAG: 4Fe-4S binding protein [Deltaproteobacteria bacterium]|nr:4Fe-4S binding protein [Deltaproteobacteria bacterium]